MQLSSKLIHLSRLNIQIVRTFSSAISSSVNSFKAKQCSTSAEAVSSIPDGATIMVGGFGLCGIPENSIRALTALGRKNLTIISNNSGAIDKGIGQLLSAGLIKRVIGGYIGENPELVRRYLSGEVEVEFVPQGTLAERIRAQAAGIPAFYTPTGYGTQIHLGGAPVLYDSDGKVQVWSTRKEERVFGGKNYVMEKALHADFSLIKAWKADQQGNVVFRKTSRNFNDPMCKAGARSIVEVEEIVETGTLDPDQIHVPSIYVHSFYKGEYFEKPIAKLRLREEKVDDSGLDSSNFRNNIARRAALELNNGSYANLGVGIPLLVTNHIPKDRQIIFHSENGIFGMGPYPRKDEVDPDLINAGKEPITAQPGASIFASDESFAIIRGGHLQVTILGTMQVSQYGDLANWMIPGKLVKGMGGAMDLVSAHVSGTRVLVTTEHNNSKSGEPKIVAECSLPLTGTRCVDMIITEKAVFEVHPEDGLTLVELAEGQTVDTIREATGCGFKVSQNLQTMKQH